MDSVVWTVLNCEHLKSFTKHHKMYSYSAQEVFGPPTNGIFILCHKSHCYCFGRNPAPSMSRNAA